MSRNHPVVTVVASIESSKHWLLVTTTGVIDMILQIGRYLAASRI